LAFGYTDPVLASHPALGSAFFPGLVINETQEEAAAAGYSQWYTGENENWNIRQYKKWHDSDSIKCLDKYGLLVEAWDSSIKYDANRVFGTNADIFQRNLPKGGYLPGFVDVIYREITLVNENELEVDFKGINLYRYVLPQDIMANATTNPINAAYYAFGDSGMLNLSKCSEGAPVYISKPHFLDVYSATNTTTKVSGLSPDRNAHDTFVDVEPITGITMHAAKRLQINSLTQPVTTGPPPRQQWFSELQPLLYIPVLWIEEGGEIKDSDAEDFKSSVILAENLGHYLYWIGFVIGYVAIGVGTIRLVHLAYSGQQYYSKMHGINRNIL